MNGSDDDIRWLRDQQPEVELPKPGVSSQARAAVMAHATRAPQLAPVVPVPTAARPRRGRLTVFSRPRRAIAIGTAVVAVAASAFAATLAVSPDSGDNGIESAVAPGVANAQSLVLLADTVAAAPAKGDATLVFHRNATSSGVFTGADLYLDNGRYYYAMTLAGLPDAVKSGPQDYTIAPIVRAMAATSNADPKAARAAFLKAADPEWAGNIQHSSRAIQDNVIWVAGIDVLGASYGRPAALAGTLRALSTVHGVRVTHAMYHGVPTLEIAMKVPAQTTTPATLKLALKARLKAAGGHLTQAEKAALGLQKIAASSAKQTTIPTTIPAHYMRATVAARTGALLRYTDIGLVVTYHVSRVDASRYGVR
jgi:hypothetical protein